MCFGDVLVTRQVVSYARRSTETGLLIGEDVLDLPERRLPTRAVWWTISAGAARRAGSWRGSTCQAPRMPPSTRRSGCSRCVAACDRWDVGGVSADLHPATGKLTVFVYDGHAGGAGLRRARLRGGPRVADGNGRRHCQLRMRGRLPVLHSVAKVRQWQSPARQAGCGHPASLPAGRLRRSAGGQLADQLESTSFPGQSSRRQLSPDMGRPPSGGRTGVARRSGSGGAEPGPLLKKA